MSVKVTCIFSVSYLRGFNSSPPAQPETGIIRLRWLRVWFRISMQANACQALPAESAGEVPTLGHSREGCPCPSSKASVLLPSLHREASSSLPPGELDGTGRGQGTAGLVRLICSSKMLCCARCRAHTTGPVLCDLLRRLHFTATGCSAG